MCYRLKFFIFLLCIFFVKANQKTSNKTCPVDLRNLDDRTIIALLAEVLNDQNKLEILKDEIKKLAVNTTKENEVKEEKANHTDSKTIPESCQEVKERDYTGSSIFLVQPKYSFKPFFVLCDLETIGGGWTIVLKRYSGVQNFNRSWNDYKKGFGNLAGEFWLGLEKLHQLTGYELNELYIELVDWHDVTVYALYNSFSLGGEEEGYAITILDGYSGTAGDSFSYHSGSKFSAKDKDQDNAEHRHCGKEFGAGWWFNGCRQSLLTGKYMLRDVSKNNYFRIMHWNTFHGHNYSLKQVRMMVRPQSKH